LANSACTFATQAASRNKPLPLQLRTNSATDRVFDTVIVKISSERGRHVNAITRHSTVSNLIIIVVCLKRDNTTTGHKYTLKTASTFI
jgi:hypothetical protein